MTMLTLCGVAYSNYYNKVKLVLLEKGLPFVEEVVPTHSRDEAVLAASPLAKVPFLRTPEGPLCESQVINDYLEAIAPQPALVPSDPYQAAKVRELATFVDLHLELVARELYPQAFFGGSVDEATQARVRKRLTRHIQAFERLAKFDPFVAGASFTLADASAYVSLPVIALACRKVFGEDLLAAAGVDWRGYVERVGERPSAQRVSADREAADASVPGKR
jgi:glutathione S-transferase